VEPAADLVAITDWLAPHRFRDLVLEPLPGDVSPRRYFRIRHREGTAIVAHYPPEARPACARFLATGALLAGAGVRVPGVLAADCAAGLMLLEDVGSRTLYEHGGEPWQRLEPFFAEALRLGLRVGGIPEERAAALNPPLAEDLLDGELRQTWDLLLVPGGLAELPLREPLEATFRELCRRLGAAPARPAHRDFMARNLVPLGDGPELAVLDHQDLRLAPAAYDLASLLNDSLFPPPDVEERLLGKFLPAFGADRLAYHRAAAQRTLKAAGTFMSFARRGFRRHLALIPPTLERALGHLAALPEGEELVGELAPSWRRRGFGSGFG